MPTRNYTLPPSHDFTLTPLLSKIQFILEESVTQCVAHLNLISAVREVLIEQFIEKLNIEQFNKISTTINNSYTFALNFNKNIEQRIVLWKNGKKKEKAIVCYLILQNLASILLWGPEPRRVQICTPYLARLVAY